MRIAKTIAVFQAITQRAVNTDVIDPDKRDRKPHAMQVEQHRAKSQRDGRNVDVFRVKLADCRTGQ